MSIQRASLLAVATVAFALTACQRTPTDDSASAEAVAEADVEAAVEEPFVVEGATAGEEATIANTDATPTPVELPPSPDTPVASPAATDPAATSGTVDPHAGKPDNSSVKSTAFWASGNEPFWNFDVDDKMMNFKTLENQTGWMLPVSRSGEGNKVTYSGVHEGKPFSFTITKRTCMDSMSGQKFDYAVKGQLNGNNYDGCSRAK